MLSRGGAWFAAVLVLWGPLVSGCDNCRQSSPRGAGADVVVLRSLDSKRIPNATLHVIKGLQPGAGKTGVVAREVRRVALPLDVTHAAFHKRPGCRHFVLAGYLARRRVYFHLTYKLDFLQVPKSWVPARCRHPISPWVRSKPAGRPPALSAPTRRILLEVNVGDGVREVSMEIDRFASRLRYGWFNGGRSLLLLFRKRSGDSSNGHDVAYLVPDVYHRRPQSKLLLRLNSSQVHNIIKSEGASRFVFLTRNSPGKTTVVKLDPFGGNHLLSFGSIGSDDLFFGRHIARAGVLCFSSADGNTHRCVDDKTGQLRFALVTRRGRIPGSNARSLNIARPGTTWTMIDNKLVDLSNGRIVAEVPGFGRSPVLGADRKLLYYITRNPRYRDSVWGSPFTRLQVFDLQSLKVVQHLDFRRVGAPPTDPSTASIYKIMRVGKDVLVAYGGQRDPSTFRVPSTGPGLLGADQYVE